GSVSGLLTAGISFTDAWHEFAMGDDAGLGYALVTAGGVALGTGALMGHGAVLLGLGPKGWLVLGLGLVLSGAAAAWLLDDTPLEEWLRHGPFGGSTNSKTGHLRQEDIAYHRLLGILLNI